MAEIIEATGKTVEDALSYALDKLGCGRAEITYEILQKPSSGFLGLWGKREARIRVTTRPVIPARHTELPLPAQPTVIAQQKTDAQENQGDADGFSPRPKRFHTDLRSRARKNNAEQYVQSEGRLQNARPDTRRERPGRYENTDAGDDQQRRPRSETPLVPLTPAMAAAAEKFLGEIFASMRLSVALHRTDTPAGTVFNMQGENLGILIGKHGATLDALQYLTNLVVNKITETGFARIILDVEDYRARREETLMRLAGHLADKACRIGEEIRLEPMSRHERKIIHTALQDNRRVTTYSAGENPRRYVVIVPKRRRYGRDYEESSGER